MNLVAAGFIFSILNGLVMPCYGFILPKLFMAMTLEQDKIMPEVNFYALMMTLAATAYGIFSYFQKYTFSTVGSNIAMGCRQVLYQALLTKDLGWHDDIKNSAGITTVVLAKDTNNVEGVATETAAIGIQTSITMLISIGLAFYYSWQLSAFAMAFVPAMLVGAVMQMKYDPVMGTAFAELEAETQADVLASDSILNYKTVQSFGSDDIMI